MNREFLFGLTAIIASTASA